MVEIGVQVLELLSRCSLPGPAGRDPTAALAAGEHPAAQACVLYVLRTSIINQLSEPGQVCFRPVRPPAAMPCQGC